MHKSIGLSININRIWVQYCHFSQTQAINLLAQLLILEESEPTVMLDHILGMLKLLAGHYLFMLFTM